MCEPPVPGLYLIYYKNFSKCHNVPPPITTIEKRNHDNKPFSIAKITAKLRIILTKEVKDFFNENLKLLMKKTLVDRKIFHIYGVAEIILLKCLYY
jgi:hypothetical protein